MAGSLCFLFHSDLRDLLAVLLLYVLLKRAERTSGNAHALTVDADNLKVHVLATLGGDVGVTAGVAEKGTLSTQLANAGHRKYDNDGKIMAVG